MAFEKEICEIIEIGKDIEKINERLKDFAYEIETDDVTKSLKQIKTLKNTVERISNHLISLSSVEQIQEYLNDKLEQEKAKLEFDLSLHKVRKALHNNSMIDAITLNQHRISKEDMESVCSHFGIDYFVGSHGSWTWISFKKDDKILDSDELREIGLIVTEPISKRVVETNDEPEIEEEQSNSFGWLSPMGEFIEGDFGEHEETAYEIIKKKQFKEEFKQWKSEDTNNLLARDFLNNVKGYVLLHNPVMGCLGRTIASYVKAPTKKQREFLYDYFMREHDEGQANYFIQMED